MTDDLVTWLRAQLDDDERVARAATPGPWYRHDAYLDVGGHTATVLSGEPGKSDLRAWLPTRRGDVFWDAGRNVWNDAAYIAQHNPARVLAEVDAKRRILDEHGIEYPGEAFQYCRVCHDHSRHDAAAAPCRTLRLLALPYADRPGYRQEWAPDA